MSKHTPGPWKQHLVDDYLIIDKTRLAVAAAYQADDVISDETASANARLIAAAPELLDAVKTLRAWVKHWEKDKECNLTPTEASLTSAIETADRAIAKAEGRDDLKAIHDRETLI